MKKACILTNAYANMHAASGQARRLKEELEAFGIAVDMIRNGSVHVGIACDGSSLVAPHDYDFCVYLDKDKYTSRLLEKKGLRLFNRHEGIQVCDDKMETFLRLADHGIPVPRTIPAPLCYYPGIAPNEEFLLSVETELGLPVVVKECYGSLGAQVYLARSHEELVQIASGLQGKQHLFQEFIEESAGRDVRVIVIGGSVVAAMKRISDADFRSNIELGGHGEPFDLPKEAAVLCEKAASILGLDYCGIDLLFKQNGFCLCEINSNAFFEGIEAVTGINIARHYVKHMLRTVYR